MSRDGGELLHLVIRHPGGRVLFEGDLETKSGLEIYGKEIRASGIKPGQSIVVTVSRP